MISSETILDWLEEVKDPEIPVISLVDLGIIREVHVSGTSAELVITPTFVGCPAMELMKQEITDMLTRKGLTTVTIKISYAQPWTSDDISAKGRHALKQFGLAPPPHSSTLITDLHVLEHIECPRCNGTNTELRTTFGATLCRSIHYCHDCREAFEQFKPI